MGYDHSLNAAVYFKPAVKIVDALSSLTPLSDYFGWTLADLLENHLDNENSVQITADDGVITHLSIYTCGEVGHSFSDLVQAFAEKLSAIATPSSIELRDHDTGDLENAIQLIWYGDPDEVVQAQRVHAWHEAAAALRGVGIAEDVLTKVASLLELNPEQLVAAF